MLPESFFTITFTISMVASIITTILGLAIIVTVIIHRPSHTIKNLLLCNTVVATCIFGCFQIVLAAFGLGADSLHPPPACLFQAYFYNVTCAMVCASYLIQSISSLFYAVLYKYKYLLGWKTHWLMIGVSYLVAFLGPLLPLCFDYSNVFEPKARVCSITLRVFHSSMLAVTTSYLIPLSVISTIYGIIYYKTRQSARRIAGFATGRSTNPIGSTTPNLQHEWKLMKNILTLVSIVVFTGIPYLTLTFWHAATSVPPPDPLYLLACANITVFFVVKMLVLIHLNKEVKMVMIEFIFKLFRR